MPPRQSRPSAAAGFPLGPGAAVDRDLRKRAGLRVVQRTPEHAAAVADLDRFPRRFHRRVVGELERVDVDQLLALDHHTHVLAVELARLGNGGRQRILPRFELFDLLMARRPIAADLAGMLRRAVARAGLQHLLGHALPGDDPGLAILEIGRHAGWPLRAGAAGQRDHRERQRAAICAHHNTSDAKSARRERSPRRSVICALCGQALKRSTA